MARNERSLKPSALTGTHELLRCPEVLRRVDPDATDDQRHQAAHDALKAALASLPLRDQLIGEAILAAPSYEGENVDQRKRKLEKDHSISERTYGRRRRKILNAIVQFLIKPDSIEVSNTRTPATLAHHQEALRAIEWVLIDATELAYACSAYQFVCALDQTLGDAHYWPPTFRTGNESALLNAIYARHMDLIISAGYCFDDQPYSLLCQHRLSTLPAASVTSFTEALYLIFGSLPFASSYERADICRDYLAPIADLLKERSWRSGHKALWTIRFHQLRVDAACSHLNAVRDGYGHATAVARDWFKLMVIRAPEFRLRLICESVASYYGVNPAAIVYEASHITLYDHLEHFCEHGTLLVSALPR